MDQVCERFMQQLRKDFRGHKAEISPHMLVRYTKRFSLAYRMSQNQILDALIRRNWLEPSAADTYWINYEAVRK